MKISTFQYRFKRNAVVLLLLCLTLFLSSCIKDNSGSINSNMIVIQAYLYPGEPVTNFQITNLLSFASADTIIRPVSNAIVSISGNGKTYQLMAADTNGNYAYMGNDLQILPLSTYIMNVNYNNKIITSQTTVPLPPDSVALSDSTITIDTTVLTGGGFFRGQNTLPSLILSWKNTNSDYFFIKLDNLETTPELISFGFRGTRIGRRFVSQPVQTSSSELRIPTEIQYYGHYRIRLYRVTKDYALLYENRQQDSRNLTEPLTNIHNGLGIFTAFSPSDSLFFRVIKL
jgi:hypothetical protein